MEKIGEEGKEKTGEKGMRINKGKEKSESEIEGKKQKECGTNIYS